MVTDIGHTATEAERLCGARSQRGRRARTGAPSGAARQTAGTDRHACALHHRHEGVQRRAPLGPAVRGTRPLGRTVRLMAPTFVAPYRMRGKRGKNDAADAAAIREAVQRPTMRFLPPKSIEQQGRLMVHRARQGFVEQRTATLNRIRGLLAEVDAGEAMDEGSAVPGGAVERDGRRSAARRREDGPRARDASRPCAGAAATRSSAHRRRGPQPRTRSTRCSDTANTCAPRSQAKDMQRA